MRHATAGVISAVIIASVTGATIVSVRSVSVSIAIAIVWIIVVAVTVISVRVTPPPRKAGVAYEDNAIRESMIVTTPIAAPVSSPP